jgi:hypothetical protein
VAERPGQRVQGLGHEPSDVSVRGVLLTAFGGLLALAVAGVAIRGLEALYGLHDAPPPSALDQRSLEPPPHRLQTDPAEDLAAYVAREEAILDSYAWIDRKAGIARIPIDRAIEMLAERGWPEPAEGEGRPPQPVTGRGKADR